MSRGHGALQRWLAEHLPETGWGATVWELSHGYFGGMPTAGQQSSVRRALGRLRSEGNARRYVDYKTHGQPTLWCAP